MVDSVAGVFVPVDVLAREQGVTADAVIEKIQAGALVGRKQASGWHVMVRAPGGNAGSGPSGVAAPPAAASPAIAPPTAPVQSPAPRSFAPVAAVAPPAIVTQAEFNGHVRVDGIAEVVVRDVQIRFTAMIALILKFLFACIPVGIILAGIGFAGMWAYEKYGDLVMSYIKPFL
jgi:hypothetical protein